MGNKEPFSIGIDQAKQLIEPLVPAFRTSILSSLDLYENDISAVRRASLCSRSKSSIVNDIVISELKKNIQGISGVCFGQLYECSGLFLNNESVFVRVKKFDKHRRPMNVLTNRQTQYQQVGFTDLGEKTIQILLLGYYPDQAFSEIRDISVVPNCEILSNPWELKIYNYLDAQSDNLFPTEFSYPQFSSTSTGMDDIRINAEQVNEGKYPYSIRSGANIGEQTGTNGN